MRIEEIVYRPMSFDLVQRGSIALVRKYLPHEPIEPGR